jgi:hypothetical protein
MITASLALDSAVTARPGMSELPLASFTFLRAASLQDSQSQNIDWEERRWQLEWDRRNIED